MFKKRSDRLVKKLSDKVDTIYSYSVAFNDFNLIWYQETGYLYSFLIEPYRTKKYKPIKIKDISVSKEDMDIYFGENVKEDILCFPTNLLDSRTVCIYVKSENQIYRKCIAFDGECLFGIKFKTNTFPYKLQYIFSKIWRPTDFEEMYSE